VKIRKKLHWGLIPLTLRKVIRMIQLLMKHTRLICFTDKSRRHKCDRANVIVTRQLHGDRYLYPS